ncbi:MAG: RluA family pseudouridine synthase [Fuerstiella sp.]|nr:RluA family pseudouridine synthase [Fuerstiella sp.]
MAASQQFTITENTNETVLAAMRRELPGALSWSAVRKIQNERRIAIGGVLCIDEARRLTSGEVVTISDVPIPPPPTEEDVTVCHVDKDVIVVEKPSGMTTLRRNSELGWSAARRLQQPTLDECVPRLIREHAAKRNKSRKVHQRLMKLYSVHRIDRDSSGLLVFARNEAAQKKIIQQFADHHAVRMYFALIPGQIADQTIASHFIRDRGDGLRGSTIGTSAGQPRTLLPTDTLAEAAADPTDESVRAGVQEQATAAVSAEGSTAKPPAAATGGQQAITHVRSLRSLGRYRELECRLETGRTNQIRIHLAELGHPICGDIKYSGPFGGPVVKDDSGVRRLALHAAELKFDHPVTGKSMHFKTAWPADMQRFLNRLQVAANSERSAE